MKKFFQNLKTVIASLGLQSKFEKRELTAEDQKALIDAYNAANGENSFQTDLQEFEAEQQRLADAEARNRIFQELATVLGRDQEDTSNAALTQMVAAVKELKETVAKLGAASQGDNPQDRVSAVPRASGPHTDKYAFGVQHPLFAASKRYNRIAIEHAVKGMPTDEDAAVLRRDMTDYSVSLSERMKIHIENGTLNDVIKGTVDYSALTDDPEIGSRYLTVRQDALIARIVTLPNLDGLFSKISNIQSGQIITNVLFTEVSQAYQKGRVFKGNITFKPEKAVVDKAMAKIQFEDMSALERSYLNYLNKSGSDPVKWSLIEWLILQLATQISNERIRRAIMGYRIEPTEGEAGHTLFASTGVVHRLIQLYEEKKVLPFLSQEVAEYDKEDIGDVLVLFAEMLAARREDWNRFTVYMNQNHLPWYRAWYKATYGMNTDYTGVVDRIPDYGLQIKWVPGMGNLKLIFATVDGNINLLENVPGEEYRMQFQRDLEEVIAYSYWMEGAGVAFGGVQKDTLADLKAADATEQMVFMNWPAVAIAADATTADASAGILFTTGENTKTTAIADITGAKEGVIYRIECGSTTNATTIAKSGKFADIKSAWSPAAEGEFIKVYYDKTADKFYEAARG